MERPLPARPATDRTTRRVVDVVLVLAAVACLGFYAFLLQRFNAAPVLRGEITPGHAADFQMGIEHCTTSTSKVAIGGWIARAGVHRDRHATTAVLRDDADGRLYVLRTAVVLRHDVTARLNASLGDQIDYDDSGFSASLNVGRSGLPIRSGRVLIAYDDGGRYTLVPTTCIWKSSP